MSKYLYGAAVQGIQDFIFKTNNLQHIVGASELVEEICTVAFNEFGTNGESVVHAAGNVKFIFNDEEDCKKAFLRFPKKVMTMAPGITISQAIVELQDDFSDAEFSQAIDDIENLLKTQRNKPQRSVTFGLMGMKRANNTGLPVTKVIIDSNKEKLYLDDATTAKLGKTEKNEEEENKSNDNNVWKLSKKSFGLSYLKHDKIAYEVSKLTDKNDWIAIIHADGNGLGQIVQKVGKKKDIFKVFSQKLDEATTEAAHQAYTQVIGDHINKNGVIPARPVVLSGDDMTIIIRGDLAIDYATVFINAFEAETRKRIGTILKEFKVFEGGEDYLTACAGIAFIKSSYPFYYGYQLAEELCGQAKKDTKEIAREGLSDGTTANRLPSSCLMFHKVQDSFITTYKDIEVRELKTHDGQLSFKAGPYYTNESPKAGKHTIQELKDASNMLNSDHGEGIKSGIRNWISLRLDSKSEADQRKNRMKQVFLSEKVIDILTNEQYGTCIAYDALAYYSIQNQQTK